MSVIAALRCLLTGLIDYAGLFPPAQLPLAPAVRNYAHYLTSPHSWMLGRFILPAAQLEAVEPDWMAWFSPLAPLELSVLCTDLALDLPRLTRWLATYPDQARAAVAELRWGDEEALADRLEKDQAELAAAGLAATLYYELPFNAAWEARLPAAMAALAAARQQGWEVGFKLRCGGVTPAMFPTPRQAALAVIAARDAHVPLKATAGLHHPLRRYDATVSTFMHGFINLFGGGVLAHVHSWDVATLEAVLLEEAPSAFGFDDSVLHWRAWSAGLADIEQVRQTRLIAYGSCSFDEPRDDLVALGWLPADLSSAGA